MRKGLLTILMLTLSVLLAACGSSGNENSESSEDNNSSQEASGEKWSEIKEEGKMVVGTAGTLFPASYYPEGSDELTGYDIEIMREVAKRLDLELSFKEYGVDALLSSINSGRVDMVINDFQPTEDRKEKFAFSEPYKYSYSTMVVRESDLSGIETLDDLEGKLHGGGATTVYSDIAKHFGAETKSYGNVANDVYLRDVANGRTDFIINDYYLQTLALKALPEIEVQLHPDLQFHPTTSAIVMPKDAQTLKEKVDATLQEMREDGTLTEISKEFFGGKDASKKPEKDVRELEGIDL
ncbi:amino acid ABC transporter substrate-binding protein [Halobacillus halophilus]|uniref:ABC-type transport system extracellular binding protein (Probable substrate amino acid) n=1 Tax=Halobacillus halophilus (strain ATCC 35676 / DSM 2266 / JCM 20832 / KCTC 3685 / LMG 17431 / NBRC 102448 / NCIMB 2269) TaxID=866895 RepID=I0JJ94_HALH3|nr:transporter substrate-binding domain-containing protein [Halobacillus halophilus]ASF38373.1 amino acid ABC transporter substrate-binding protein [Halobacillus halophilus]CCG44212.1 ABC-type transport system extracellular binding protein (probable substrate amino acid) [Halobacillus halophilus DSM 2266]